MSLVNDYLKQLSRKSSTPKDKGVDFVPPSLQRTQRKSWRSRFDAKYLSFAGFIVLLSCFGYLLISLVSILLYPVVDVSVAVEPKLISEVDSEDIYPERPVAANQLVKNHTPQLGLLAKVDNSTTKKSPLASNEYTVAEMQPERDLQPKKNDAISTEEGDQNPVAPTEPLQTGHIAPTTHNKMDSSIAIEEPRPLAETLNTTDTALTQPTQNQKSPKRIIIKESNNTPDYIYQLALQAQHSNKYGRAERYYRDVLAERPDHENALVNLSAIYIQEKRFQEAQMLLNKVISLNPKNSKALVNFGMIELQQKKNDVAANYFLQALRLNPIEETALRNMAFLSQLDKNYTEAGKYFEQLLRISPDDIDILLAYAGLEEMKKKYKSAIKIYRQCLEQIDMQKHPERQEEILIRIQVLKQYSAEQAY